MQSTLGEKEVGGKLSLEVGQERPLREEAVMLELWASEVGRIFLGRGLVEDSCWELQVGKCG